MEITITKQKKLITKSYSLHERKQALNWCPLDPLIHSNACQSLKVKKDEMDLVYTIILQYWLPYLQISSTGSKVKTTLDTHVNSTTGKKHSVAFISMVTL